MPSNFAMLEKNHPKLAALGQCAEHLLPTYPAMSIGVLRIFSELLAAVLGDEVGERKRRVDEQDDYLQRLPVRRLPPDMRDKLSKIWAKGSIALHTGVGDASLARAVMEEAKELADWFHKRSNETYVSVPFITPQPDTSAAELKLRVTKELALQQENDAYRRAEPEREDARERLEAAWDAVIRSEDGLPRPRVVFGGIEWGLNGFSDNNNGVQWNAWTGTHSSLKDEEDASYLGVNLEGMEYQGFPIASLLLSEKEKPLLRGAIKKLGKDAHLVSVVWWQDAWEDEDRNIPFDGNVLLQPTRLSDLTDPQWTRAIAVALKILPSQRQYRAFGEVEVTLRGETRKLRSSPHLQFRTILWPNLPPFPEKKAAREFMREGKERMQPLYDFVKAATRIPSSRKTNAAGRIVR